jgi:hypothetical protein
LTHATRRSSLIATVVLFAALAVAACDPRSAISTPSPSASPSPVASVASVAPSAPPSVAVTTPAPGVTPGPSVACAVIPQTGTLPSDRVTGIQVLGLPGTDVVRFEFSPGSLTPAGPPVGSLEAATPPFTEGASGLPIDLEGQHALQVVFRGMSLQNDVGQETYAGEREIRVTDPSRSLRHVVVFDESEGQMGWYLGYDGPACVTLAREGDDIVVSIAFGPGS